MRKRVELILGNGARVGRAHHVWRFAPDPYWVGVDFGIQPNFHASTESEFVGLLPKRPSRNGMMKHLFVTHAHLDHTAALPLLPRWYTDIKIYMTLATLTIAQDMIWNQTIRIANQEKRQSLFTQDDIDRLLGHIEIIEADRELEFEHFSVLPFSNGHILGSVCYIFTPKNGADPVFDSGDISFQSQVHVKGTSSIPSRFSKFSIALMESTNINSVGYVREHEERYLIERVSRVLAQKGKVLIPVFSIARAPEVYTALRRQGIKVFVDGGARQGIKLYSELIPGFEYDERDFVSRENRDGLLNGSSPCVVLASSGMLLGNSVSVLYAERWLGRENCSIFIVGYQAPHTRGYELLKSRKNSMIRFGSDSRFRACEVERFHLSSHCDGVEIGNLLKRLNPEVAVLNHGDPEIIKRFIENDTSGLRLLMAKTGKEVST